MPSVDPRLGQESRGYVMSPSRVASPLGSLGLDHPITLRPSPVGQGARVQAGPG